MQPYKIIITAEWDPEVGLLITGRKYPDTEERVTNCTTVAEIESHQYHTTTVARKMMNAAIDLIEEIK